MDDDLYRKAGKLISMSKYIVCFTGAGISTESGLADYRGPNGVWTRRDQGLPPPKSKKIDDVLPNRNHKVINQLIEVERIRFLISQNIDGLHIKSGVPFNKISELHGNHFLLVCDHCEKQMTYEKVGWDRRRFGPGYRKKKMIRGQPGCPYCGSRLYSSIVNFGDALPEKALNLSIYHSERADLMIVIGSSLVVTPAANLPMITKENGGKLVVINKGKTPLDAIVDIRIWDDIGDSLQHIYNAL